MEHVSALGHGYLGLPLPLVNIPPSPNSNYIPPILTRFGNHTPTPQLPSNANTPYIPPFCRETPPHIPQTPQQLHAQQLPTPLNSSPVNPFTDATTPRPATMFYQHLQQSPISPLTNHSHNSATLARQAADKLIPFADDENGRQGYARTIAVWEQIHGTGIAMFTGNLLPLSLGTDCLSSKECYHCGKATQPLHVGSECTDPVEILMCESQWWSYINKFLHPLGQRGTPYTQHRSFPPQAPIVAQIALSEDEIEYDPYLYPVDTLDFEEGSSSGNGMKSHR